MDPLTPYVYVFEFVFWLATLTAHKPTRSEMTSFNCARGQHAPPHFTSSQIYAPCGTSRQPAPKSAPYIRQSARRRRKPCRWLAVS
ncbi:zinc homeostasis factor 1 [Alternaria alternata]|nr:zinc homeostasis factor 1 [Alternaria alternata]